MVVKDNNHMGLGTEDFNNYVLGKWDGAPFPIIRKELFSVRRLSV